ncbi:hypothetical protein EDD11_001298 [Mortierella claussenii]|nr:hypothetical protein EDD11_001298 [Mortierella claussenii]
MDAAALAREIVKGIPAGLVISLNAWATILINSQPRWLFRKKRWSEGEMRAISCYYLVVAYLMLRVVRLTSTLTRRPGRPYGDFFRNTRPILGKVAIFSIATMILDEFIMFYILRKFGLEKRRILITGKPLDKKESHSTEAEGTGGGIEEWTDDDCCICYGAMLDDDDDFGDQDDYSSGSAARETGGLSKDTDHVLENFCVMKQHVAHRGCIRKWYNYGPKGYRPMEAFRIFNWGTTLQGAVAAGMVAARQNQLGQEQRRQQQQQHQQQQQQFGQQQHPQQGNVIGNQMRFGWLLSTLPIHARGAETTTMVVGMDQNVQLRIPLTLSPIGGAITQGPVAAGMESEAAHGSVEVVQVEDQASADRMEPAGSSSSLPTQQTEPSETRTHEAQVQEPGLGGTTDRILRPQQSIENAADAAEPVLRPLFPPQETLDPVNTNNNNDHQNTTDTTNNNNNNNNNNTVHDVYTLGGNAGRKTCPACRQQLVLNFIDLAKGRKEMGYFQKLKELGKDMTKFSDWRGLILRSLITAGWVGVTIVGGKLRIVAMDKALVKHQKNRALATLSTLMSADA